MLVARSACCNGRSDTSDETGIGRASSAVAVALAALCLAAHAEITLPRRMARECQPELVALVGLVARERFELSTKGL
jgi:hypothetical protein